jgi:hypothetical protein
MKTNLKNIGLVFLATIALVSCNNDDEWQARHHQQPNLLLLQKTL